MNSTREGEAAGNGGLGVLAVRRVSGTADEEDVDGIVDAAAGGSSEKLVAILGDASADVRDAGLAVGVLVGQLAQHEAPGQFEGSPAGLDMGAAAHEAQFSRFPRPHPRRGLG